MSENSDENNEGYWNTLVISSAIFVAVLLASKKRGTIVTKDESLKGKVAIITGANCGIGF